MRYSLRFLKPFPVVLNAVIDEVREQVRPLVSPHPDLQELMFSGIKLLVGSRDKIQNVLLPYLLGVGSAVECSYRSIRRRSDEELDQEREASEDEDADDGSPSYNESHAGDKQSRPERKVSRPDKRGREERVEAG